MSDTLQDRIWSEYTTSPDPALDSLYQVCQGLSRHVLQPSHIVLTGGGFTLHPDLAGPLTELIPAMDRLLRLAERHYGLRSTSSFCQHELHVLTTTTGLFAPATLNQVVWNWVHLVAHLKLAMARLEAFWKNYPLPDPNCPSRMRYILSSLPHSLLVKLPNAFLDSHRVRVMPAPANASQIHRQKAAFIQNIRRHQAETVRAIASRNDFSHTPVSARTCRLRCATIARAAACVVEIRSG
ncbi:hypothetical protein C8F04DRAFT_1103298 [Mycena alexandri]|uniref:Uncharacterized protein n=1 Tax=Mycena alexandri TaxID=1745969 RepID=A0AAD6STV1_9AGAR|nr:hypothetical protein C8F04DRAFT_1103298 [Mycena alexandri]